MADSRKRARAGGKHGTEPPTLSFEDSIGRLEQIVQRLETDDLPLEDALALFEEGVKLARSTQHQLESAEKRVEQLLGIDEEGNPVVRELGGDETEE